MGKKKQMIEMTLHGMGREAIFALFMYDLLYHSMVTQCFLFFFFLFHYCYFFGVDFWCTLLGWILL